MAKKIGPLYVSIDSFLGTFRNSCSNKSFEQLTYPITIMTATKTKIIVTETEPVITTRDPKATHNFGPVSFREETLYTAERPGHPGTKGVPTEIVDDWIRFIQSKGIRHVLIIMEVNVLATVTYFRRPSVSPLFSVFG